MQLEWINHPVQLLEGVSDLLKASKLVDVTITAEGKKIRAHRLILSAASTYFRVSYQSWWGPHSTEVVFAFHTQRPRIRFPAFP